MSGSSLRRVARLQRGVGFPHDHQGVVDAELPFFKVGDFGHPDNERYLNACANWVSSETAQALRAVVVPAGSVLLPKIGAALLANARRITTRPCVFDNNVLAVIPTRVESRYLYYWLSTLDLAELANPGPIPSLSDSALLDQVLPSDDIAQQDVLGNFLDAETARIDALIVAKRRLIARLRERRAAITVAAVTGAFTSQDAPRIAGGLPWVASIPASWRTVKLTLVARLGSGHTPSRHRPEWWENCSIPWVTTGEVAQLRDAPEPSNTCWDPRWDT